MLAAAQQIASSGATTIALHQFGGTGAPLLICHAASFCAAPYAPLADALGNRHSIWGLDFRGHGASGRPEDGDFSWGRMADDVTAVLETFEEPAHVFGHSMGGAAVLLAACRIPVRISSVYVYEPAILPTAAPYAESATVAAFARQRSASFASRGAAHDLLRHARPYSAITNAAFSAFLLHGLADTASGNVTLCCRPEDEAACYDSGMMPWWEASEVTAPTTLACGGTHGSRETRSAMSALCGRLPNAVLRSHPTLGHFGPLEAPDVIAHDVLRHTGAHPTR